MLLAIEDIHINGNVRLTEEGIADLARSMKTVGQITAIQVSQQGTEWHLVSGHRRLAAARSLGWAEIRVEEVETENTLAVQLAENISRNALTPFEIAQGVLALKDTGLNQGQIADALGMAKAEVSNYQKIARGAEGIDPLSLNQLTLDDLDFYGQVHDMPDGMRERFVADHEKGETSYWALHNYVDEVNVWRWTQRKENKALMKSLEDIGAVPMSAEDRAGSKSLHGAEVIAHRGQPCHGYIVNRSWSDEGGYAVFEYCLDPQSHLKEVDPETGEVTDAAETLRRVAKDAQVKGITGTNQDRRAQKERTARKTQRKELVKAFADKPLMKPLIDMVFTVLLDIQKAYRWQELGKAFGLTKPVDTFHFDWDEYLSKFNAKDKVTQMLILAVGSYYIGSESTYSVSDNPTLDKLDKLFGYKTEEVNDNDES